MSCTVLLFFALPDSPLIIRLIYGVLFASLDMPWTTPLLDDGVFIILQWINQLYQIGCQTLRSFILKSSRTAPQVISTPKRSSSFSSHEQQARIGCGCIFHHGLFVEHPRMDPLLKHIRPKLPLLRKSWSRIRFPPPVSTNTTFGVFVHRTRAAKLYVFLEVSIIQIHVYDVFDPSYTADPANATMILRHKDRRFSTILPAMRPRSSP